MKTLLVPAGYLSIVGGAIWVIQGFGLIPTGSFMDQRPIWGYLGIAAILAGIVGLIFGRSGAD